MEVYKDVMELVKEKVRLHETLGNFHRFIILALIALRKKASWNEIKQGIRQLCGSINPNTLAFHLNKLIDCGFVKRDSAGNYSVVEDKLPSEVKEILPLLKEALEKGGR